MGLVLGINKQDVGHQQQCSCSRRFPNVAVASLYIQSEPQLPLPLQETPQGQQVALAQAPVKLLLLPWVPVHMKFCEHHLRVKSLFSPVLWGWLPKLSPTDPKALCSWCRTPGSDMELRTLAPVGEPLQHNTIILQFLGCLPRDMRLDYIVSLTLPSFSLWFLLLFSYLAVPHSMQDASSPEQGSNPHPLHWKHGVPTTGLPGKSLWFLYVVSCRIFFFLVGSGIFH